MSASRTGDQPEPEYEYLEVDRFTVPVESRLAATAARALAAARLHLSPPPELRWFREARTPSERLTARLGEMRRQAAALACALDPGADRDRDNWKQAIAHRRAQGMVHAVLLDGLAFQREGDAVWVSATLDAARTAWVVMHEMYHRHQQVAGTWPRKSAPDYEYAKLVAEAEAGSFADLHIQEVLAALAAQ